ncbi:MAG: hypothetical protein ACPG49_13710 [Chitinophagales bacterium]
MAAIYKKYIRDLRKKFGYQATWTPGTPLKLGDIGVFRNHVFETIDNIGNDHFDFEMLVRNDESAEELDFVSSSSVNVTTKVKGSLAPTGSALSVDDTGFTVNFGRKGGLVFKAKGVLTHRIMNQAELARYVKTAFSNGEWEDAHYIITELKEAESATILYSVEKDAQVEIRANGSLSNEALDITDAGASLEVAFSKKMEVKIVANDGLTPLFKVRGIRVKGSNANLRHLEEDEDELKDLLFEEHDEVEMMEE